MISARYLIDTYGFDVYNTSRIDGGNWLRRDYLAEWTVSATTFRRSTKAAIRTRPLQAGERTVTGGFVRWKLNYTSLLEVVSAVRYDNYRLQFDDWFCFG